MPHVLVQLPDQWKGEIRVDELILTNVQHDGEAGSLRVWNVVHPSCHETNQSHFSVVMTEAGHSRCKLILNITEIISNKEEKYRKWLQANLLLKRLTASVAVLAFFTLKDKCEKNVGGKKNREQKKITTEDFSRALGKVPLDNMTAPRVRCCVSVGSLQLAPAGAASSDRPDGDTKGQKASFSFFSRRMHEMNPLIFTKHSISLSGYTLRWSCSLLLRRSWKKKCHISLSQANNKRWVPAAASQLPNGRALLSTHLLQLWVRTLLHGSLAGGRGFVMRGSQCESHAQRPHTARRMFGLRHPEIVYMLAVFWLGQFFPIRCSHASSVASHFFFFNVCRNYIVCLFCFLSIWLATTQKK